MEIKSTFSPRYKMLEQLLTVPSRICNCMTGQETGNHNATSAALVIFCVSLSLLLLVYFFSTHRTIVHDYHVLIGDEQTNALFVKQGPV